jgi:LPXTG-motif cell wall-anchored protein
MGTRKLFGIVLLVVGMVFFILSLIADLVGVGSSHGFGPQQIIGIILGAILAVVGFFLFRKNKK